MNLSKSLLKNLFPSVVQLLSYQASNAGNVISQSIGHRTYFCHKTKPIYPEISSNAMHQPLKNQRPGRRHLQQMYSKLFGAYYQECILRRTATHTLMYFQRKLLADNFSLKVESAAQPDLSIKSRSCCLLQRASLGFVPFLLD